MELKKSAKFNPLLIWFLTFIYKIYMFTIRKKLIFSDEFQDYIKTGEPVLLAFWHQDVNTMIYISFDHQTMTMVSDSKDGQLVAQVVEQLGSVTARGSSRTNPIKALKSFLRIMKKGEHWGSIAIDGPKGPPKKAKSGIVEAARLLNCPVFTLTLAYSGYWTLKKSWDQTRIAKPFSKAVFHIGPGLPPLSKADDPKDPKLLESLENSMSRNQLVALGYLEENV
jgi:lysophospholipid acyltransferase (LPLAT)-like uncharacterized protein